MKNFLNRSFLVVGTSALAASSAFAETPAAGVTIPESGVDVAGYASAAITSLGSVVAVCIGGVVCFMIVKWGIKWVKGIGR